MAVTTPFPRTLGFVGVAALLLLVALICNAESSSIDVPLRSGIIHETGVAHWSGRHVVAVVVDRVDLPHLQFEGTTFDLLTDTDGRRVLPFELNWTVMSEGTEVRGTRAVAAMWLDGSHVYFIVGTGALSAGSSVEVVARLVGLPPALAGKIRLRISPDRAPQDMGPLLVPLVPLAVLGVWQLAGWIVAVGASRRRRAGEGG